MSKRNPITTIEVIAWIGAGQHGESGTQVQVWRDHDDFTQRRNCYFNASPASVKRAQRAQLQLARQPREEQP